jgi:hypothetical protein
VQFVPICKDAPSTLKFRQSINAPTPVRVVVSENSNEFAQTIQNRRMHPGNIATRFLSQRMKHVVIPFKLWLNLLIAKPRSA